MPRRTVEHKVSNTASYTCFSRACASREKDERFRGPDHLAEVFLPLFAKCIQRTTFLRNLFMKRVAPPGIYAYVLARTKLLDDVFVEALENSFSQIVLLGAGFDTRALRFQDRNDATRVFELDARPTQQAKVDILTRKGVAIPEQLAYVPIDFNKQSLAAVLFDAGCETDQKSLFIWEGVTMYLEPEAVRRTLAFIRDNSAEGSIVAFDYIYASVLRGENRFYGEEGAFKTVLRAGEGWTFGIEDGEIGSFLSERGFRIISHHTPADLERAYLTADDGTLFGRINGTHCIVVAATG
jgi:methyltransferase (TIGR00027 family)